MEDAEAVFARRQAAEVKAVLCSSLTPYQTGDYGVVLQDFDLDFPHEAVRSMGRRLAPPRGRPLGDGRLRLERGANRRADCGGRNRSGITGSRCGRRVWGTLARNRWQCVSSVRVIALDRSSAGLALAREHGEKLGVASRTAYVQADVYAILSPLIVPTASPADSG